MMMSDSFGISKQAYVIDIFVNYNWVDTRWQ